jgi:hypothetical protein
MPAAWRPAGGPGLLGPRPPAPPTPRPAAYGPPCSRLSMDISCS